MITNYWELHRLCCLQKQSADHGEGVRSHSQASDTDAGGNQRVSQQLRRSRHQGQGHGQEVQTGVLQHQRNPSGPRDASQILQVHLTLTVPTTNI